MGCNGCNGCSGVRTSCFSCFSCFAPRTNCNGCYGCNGYTGCTGYMGCTGVYGCAGGVMVAPAGAKTMPAGEKIDAPKKETSLPTPGTIVVTLPADAKLIVDGYVSKQTSAQRRLVTPAIQPGQEFTYTLVAETTQNGQTVSLTHQVTVRAGQQMPVNFDFSTTATATDR